MIESILSVSNLGVDKNSLISNYNKANSAAKTIFYNQTDTCWNEVRSLNNDIYKLTERIEFGQDLTEAEINTIKDKISKLQMTMNNKIKDFKKSYDVLLTTMNYVGVPKKNETEIRDLNVIKSDIVDLFYECYNYDEDLPDKDRINSFRRHIDVQLRNDGSLDVNKANELQKAYNKYIKDKDYNYLVSCLLELDIITQQEYSYWKRWKSQ